MKCEICSESNVGPDHKNTENHRKNQIFFEYSLKRMYFASNRKGAVITCNIRTCYSFVADSDESKISVSAKLDEEIQFNFTISNESKKRILNIVFIQVPQNKLNFTMNDHDFGIGSSPVSLKPKEIFPNEIYVRFKSHDIGQYELPVLFAFYKPSTNEDVVIVRDLVVYVEQSVVIHETAITPYKRKEVKAATLIRTTAKRHEGDDIFRVPKNYKPVYANNLKVPDKSTDELKSLTNDINDVFSTGITRDNYVRFFHNLLWYEETIMRINLKKYNMSGVPLVWHEPESYALFVPGLGEKRPSLMLGDLLFIKPQITNEVMFEALISDINENHIIIRGLDNQFLKYYNTMARFDIRFFMSRMPLERMHQAIDYVRKNSNTSRIFPVECKIEKKKIKINRYFNPLVETNPEQRSAVDNILAGSSGIAPYLLHGPPGTGKTVTIVEAILQVVNRDPEHRILVCTDSNMAADHVATLLLKYKHFFPTDKLLLRANSKYRVWETLPESLYKYSNGISYNTFEPVSIPEFMSYRIVVTTLLHSAKFANQFQLRLQTRPITHLFIDEAGQACEPSCLIPMVGLLQSRGLLVLAGDPLQLGPVVISQSAKTLGLGNVIGGLSMMERLKNTNPLYSGANNDSKYIVMLLNNFRSDEDILHLPNKFFYDGQLKANAAKDEISKTDILGQNTDSRAIMFHGVLSMEQKMGKSPSFYNSMEVEVVQNYVKALIGTHKVLPEDIGIVTPYIRQVYKIKAWLIKNNLSKLEVGTVEAFQGKEKRVIIVSTVRANCNLIGHDAKFQLGFLVDDKRFNVALTRAKAKAIIIGNPLCLQKDVKWLTYMEQCRRFGTYTGFDAAALQGDVTQREMMDHIMPMLKERIVTKNKT